MGVSLALFSPPGAEVSRISEALVNCLPLRFKLPNSFLPNSIRKNLAAQIQSTKQSGIS
jgi:hypothetical protein